MISVTILTLLLSQIYVPLGILLLAFAPKPSSGLSQASIFGASLGGFILNIQNKHPFTFKVHQQQSESQSQPRTSTDDNNEHVNGTETISSVPTTDHTPESTDMTQYYTRPLIDYDMALFLAPMEMAGAVLGVLIQKILPNWLYLIVASLILGFTAYKTYNKWWDSHKVEFKSESEVASDPSESHNPLLSTGAPMTSLNEASSLNPPAASLEIDYVREESAISLDHNVDAVKMYPSADVTHNTDEEVADDEHQSQDTEVVDEFLELASLDPEKIARRDYLLERDARQYPAKSSWSFAYCGSASRS